MPNDIPPVHTIGHSTRPLEEFVELLQSVGARCLVDVRSIPRSRTNPQYNLQTLPEALAQFQIRHTIIPELGGRRGRQYDVDPDVKLLEKPELPQLRRLYAVARFPRRARTAQGAPS